MSNSFACTPCPFVLDLLYMLSPKNCSWWIRVISSIAAPSLAQPGSWSVVWSCGHVLTLHVLGLLMVDFPKQYSQTPVWLIDGFCYQPPKMVEGFFFCEKPPYLTDNWLVVDLPLWKIWKSVGIIIPNIWKIIQMFQTTNQITCFVL